MGYDATQENVQINGVPLPSGGSDTWFNFSYQAEQYATRPQIHDRGAPASDRVTNSALHDDTFLMTFFAPPGTTLYDALEGLHATQELLKIAVENGTAQTYEFTGSRHNANTRVRYDLAAIVIERPQNDNATAEVEDRMWAVKGVVMNRRQEAL